VLEKLKAAEAFLRQRCGTFPDTVVVMGSGMAGVLSDLEVETEFSFRDMPHMPGVTVEGHSGTVSVGKLAGKRIAVSRGRIHYYEGHPMQMVVFPFRAMALAGARDFILTNAAGGIQPTMKPSSLLLIRDHLNLMGSNPLFGPNLAELGPRFPDISRLYNPQLREVFRRAAAKLKIDLPEGVYVAVHGPSYETPAEIIMYGKMGGDVVGMSTVPEAIALHHMGKRVVAISCITNLAAGVTGDTMNHQEVLDNAKLAHTNLGNLLREGIASMGSNGG
jgi:purine-nucleoside phosphorylase